MGKGGSSTKVPQEFKNLAGQQLSERLRAAPARNMVFQQMAEALRTGGIGARIPIIQQAVAAQRGGVAQTLSGASSDLYKRGITGPYAGSILNATRMAGENAISRIPTDYASQFINQASRLIPGLGSDGGGGGGGGAESTTDPNYGPAVGGGAAAAGAIIAAAIAA